MNSAVVRRSGLWASLLLACLALASPAQAHHPMGGDTPFTLMQGLISGFAHPVIGLDHLAFILSVGAASAFLAKRFLTPLVFVGATLAGCALQLQGVTLPLAEIAIAASVVAIGVAILSGAALPSAFYIVLFGVAGLFHGWAYGGSIVGAEQTPLVAYLLGFASIQAVIAIASMMATRALWQSAGAVPLRIAGGAIAGFGLALLVHNVESLILPGVAV
ncbi:MAG: HupE/UreJ family protein [Rhodomicrobiaceae bacterium]